MFYEKSKYMCVVHRLFEKKINFNYKSSYIENTYDL